MTLFADSSSRQQDLVGLLEQFHAATPADIEAQAVAGREGTSFYSSSALSSARSIAGLIDHTLLAPSADKAQIEQTVLDAHSFGAATLCINSAWVPFAVRRAEEGKIDLKIICTVGFPFGAGNTEAKALEAKIAVQQGAKEIDMVQNVGLLKSGDFAGVYEDVRAVCEAVQGTPVKVILETASLTRQETLDSALLAVSVENNRMGNDSPLIAERYDDRDVKVRRELNPRSARCHVASVQCFAGASFVKTSTGYGPGGATESSVRLLKHTVDYYASIQRPDSRTKHEVQVKASGGIRNLSTLRRMWECGADRVGASSTAAILREAQGAAIEATPETNY